MMVMMLGDNDDVDIDDDAFVNKDSIVSKKNDDKDVGIDNLSVVKNINSDVNEEDNGTNNARH